jgi:predicted TIM-barrel fold metal-dependent hydrolase
MGRRRANWLALLAVAAALCAAAPVMSREPKAAPLFHDSHFHLTNYVQEGNAIRRQLEIMGDRIPRSTLFGIPLQQTWDFGNTGDFAPTYYLQTDAPLYYYSFTDAFIAQQYLSLTPAERARFDPMITGFNPADMYAADHIRRVLQTFPGVFSGIGEFSIHKEFVSSKVAGNTASLTNPALDRVLAFAGEVGLVVILHNDIDVPFDKGDALPNSLIQMRDLLKRHPETTIIWAHTGLGRVVAPTQLSGAMSPTGRPLTHLEIMDRLLSNPEMSHVYLDISWDEVAKYATSSPEAIERTAAFLNRHSDRVLFGTDNVAPKSREAHLRVFELWKPVFDRLTPEASRAIRFGNYERLFDAARVKVRAWERANVPAAGEAARRR